jgi:hypothetical protein
MGGPIGPVIGGEMAKLGPYSYPDIRFGDAVEIAGRVLSKFKGVVSVKGLAWELGMAEGSGTLFAKVAAMRDFGLLEGRGELRVSPLAQRVLHPADAKEGQEARAEAFQRVDLLRQLYDRFEGEVPDDMSLLVGLEEVTRASRDEIVRRAPLIHKHLTDAIRVLGRPLPVGREPEYSALNQQKEAALVAAEHIAQAAAGDFNGGIQISAAGRHLSVPLTAEYIDVAIALLSTIKGEMAESGQAVAMEIEVAEEDAGKRPSGVAELEMGTIEQLDMPDEGIG